MVPITWDGEIAYKDALEISLMEVTNRQHRIALVLSDLFLRFMAGDHQMKPKDMSRNEAMSLIIGAIANRNISYERAVALPDELMRRIEKTHGIRGDYVSVLLEVGLEGIHECMTQKPMLHRFNRVVSTSIHRAAQKIKKEYGNDARNVWSSDTHLPLDTKAAYSRISKFHGLSLKTTTLLMRCLNLSWGVPFVGQLDASPDVHVKRVFERLGITPKNATPDEVVRAARRLSEVSGQPALYMDGAWILGVDGVCENFHTPQQEIEQKERCIRDCPLESCCLYPKFTLPTEIEEAIQRL